MSDKVKSKKNTKKEVVNKVKKKNSVKKTETKKKDISKLNKIKNFIFNNKNLVLMIVLFIVDVIMIICFARDNYANYADVEGNIIFVGKARNLLFGRNYVGLIVTFFIYFYGLLVSKFWFKTKFNINKILLLFLGLFIVNILLFYGFTIKIY